MKMPMSNNPVVKRLSKRWSATTEDVAENAQQSSRMLAERAAESGQMLAQRAEEIRQQFAQRVDQRAVTNFAGWTLVSTGAAMGLTAIARGRRGMGGLILPAVLAIVGALVLSGGPILRRRSSNIQETEARVRDDIRGLDPLARFRVLRDVAGETVPFVKTMTLRRN